MVKYWVDTLVNQRFFFVNLIPQYISWKYSENIEDITQRVHQHLESLLQHYENIPTGTEYVLSNPLKNIFQSTQQKNHQNSNPTIFWNIDWKRL